MRFVIQRDGTLTDITVDQPSGYPMLDNASPSAPSCKTRADPAAARVLSVPGDRDERDLISNIIADDDTCDHSPTAVDLSRHRAALAIAAVPGPAAAAGDASRAASRARSASRSAARRRLPPKIAVPDFIALTHRCREQVAAAKTIGQVLWDDLNFEREYYMIPRDTYAIDSACRRRSTRCRSIGGASSAPTAWSSGRCGRRPPASTVQVRLCTSPAGRSAFAKEYSGTARQPARLRAHDLGRDPPAAAQPDAASRGRSSPSRPIATANG